MAGHCCEVIYRGFHNDLIVQTLENICMASSFAVELSEMTARLEGLLGQIKV